MDKKHRSCSTVGAVQIPCGHSRSVKAAALNFYSVSDHLLLPGGSTSYLEKYILAFLTNQGLKKGSMIVGWVGGHLQHLHPFHAVGTCL